MCGGVRKKKKSSFRDHEKREGERGRDIWWKGICLVLSKDRIGNGSSSFGGSGVRLTEIKICELRILLRGSPKHPSRHS